MLQIFHFSANFGKSSWYSNFFWKVHMSIIRILKITRYIFFKAFCGSGTLVIPFILFDSNTQLKFIYAYDIARVEEFLLIFEYLVIWNFTKKENFGSRLDWCCIRESWLLFINMHAAKCLWGLMEFQEDRVSKIIWSICS